MAVAAQHWTANLLASHGVSVTHVPLIVSGTHLSYSAAAQSSAHVAARSIGAPSGKKHLESSAVQRRHTTPNAIPPRCSRVEKPAPERSPSPMRNRSTGCCQAHRPHHVNSHLRISNATMQEYSGSDSTRHSHNGVFSSRTVPSSHDCHLQGCRQPTDSVRRTPSADPRRRQTIQRRKRQSQNANAEQTRNAVRRPSPARICSLRRIGVGTCKPCHCAHSPTERLVSLLSPAAVNSRDMAATSQAGADQRDATVAPQAPGERQRLVRSSPSGSSTSQSERSFEGRR